MKRVTLGIDNGLNKNSSDIISNKLNSLSGVVAADVSTSEGKAYAYAGNKLSKEALINIIRTSGYNASILNEEYFRALEEQRGSFQ